MIKTKAHTAVFLVACLTLMNCSIMDRNDGGQFDQLNRTIEACNWRYALRVENQNKSHGAEASGPDDHYLKATLYLSNAKSSKSLLYSIAENNEDYEAKYKYLSFGSRDDLYLKCNDKLIHPIGYVFEPSNGLSTTERLVYKFQIPDSAYKKLIKNGKAVEYWYVDKLGGSGKICFKPQ